MRQENRAAEELDELLAHLHEELENGAGADRVKAMADALPDFRKEILAFAGEWLASEGSDLPDDVLAVAETVSGHAELLQRFWAMAQSEQTSPLPGTPTALRTVAERCRIDTAILRKIAKGFVEVETIPGKLIALLADATGTQAAQVWSFLTSPAMAEAGGADYFAPSGTKKGGKSSFAEVVRESELSDEDKRYWLSHMDA